MAKTEFVWLAESEGHLQTGHLYQSDQFPAGAAESWVASGQAKWREDVPANQVTIDLRPQVGATVSVSKRAMPMSKRV